MLKFSITVDFFTCALFKQYYKLTGTRADFDSTQSVSTSLDSSLDGIGLYSTLLVYTHPYSDNYNYFNASIQF